MHKLAFNSGKEVVRTIKAVMYFALCSAEVEQKVSTILACGVHFGSSRFKWMLLSAFP